MIGDFFELGPVFIDENEQGQFSFQYNNNTWNNYAHLLFVDQPSGTGFSVSNGLNVTNTPEAAQYFNYFLARFYQLYPEMVNNPLYIFGESYGGKYVPYFTYHLLSNTTFSSMITIKGMGVGDGWSVPDVQVRTYANLGYVTGLLDNRWVDSFHYMESQSVVDLFNGNFWQSTNISNVIADDWADLAGNVSILDWREYSTDGSDYPYMLWLNSSAAQTFLGTAPTDFDWCESEISFDFYQDNMQSIGAVYPYIFSQIPVIFYNGLDDADCDYEGVSNYINELNWTDIKNFRRSPRTLWTLTDGTKAGLVKSYANVTFLSVFDAGHMVPAYQGYASLEMLYNFFNNIPFNS